MQTQKNNQKGSIHIIIISLIAVAILGVIGYLLFSNLSQQKQETTEQTASSATVEEEPRGEEEAPKQKEGLLEIAAWNVAFTIPNQLKDTSVLYFARSTNDDPPQEYYAFTTTRIQDLGGKCTERTFGDTVILRRSSEKPMATPDGELINQEPVSGYYYVLSGPIASCSGFDENGNMKEPSQVEVADRALLKELAKTLEGVE